MILRTLKWKINKISNYHRQGRLPNIFIFSTARSGSTWLMEMISAQKGIKFISEPLLLTKLAGGYSPIPTSWEFLLPNHKRKDLLKKYFNDLISNKIGIGNTSPFSKLHNWKTERIVFKILRCKDLMNWFEEEFQGQIVYLLRHPIPTNLSRKRYSILPLYLKNVEFCENYLNQEIVKESIKIIKQGNELEKKVLDWCLQNIAPIKYLDKKNWLILYYEDLVMNPEENLERTINKLELKDREKTFNRYYKASVSSIQSDNDTKKILEKNKGEHGRKFLIEKWHTKVNEEEEMRVFEILKMFEINLYKFGKDMPDKKL